MASIGPYQVGQVLDSAERLQSVLDRVEATPDPEGHLVHDPAGNAIVLTA